MDILEKLVNTATGPDVSTEEKLKRTAFLLDILVDFGFKVRSGNGCHVAVRGNPPYITLIGHLDTVFPEGEEKKRPFSIVGDKAYGPGVADMKGGIAVMFQALKDIDRDNIAIILNVDEEIGSPESEIVFSEFAKKTSYCLSFEPAFPDGKLVASRKGVGALLIKTHGKKGHAARIQEGANAVVELSNKIHKIWELNRNFVDLTVNPTIIKGGIKSNVTPDYAECYCNVRYYAMNEVEKFEKEIARISKETVINGCTTEFEYKQYRKPMKECPELVEIVRKEGFKVTRSSGSGDAAFFNRAIDGLGLPGGNLHSKEEYAIISEFDKKVKLAKKLITSI